MAKKLTAQERVAEIVRLEGMCLMILDSSDGAGGQSWLRTVIVQKSVEEGDLVALRLFFRDLVQAITRGLASEEYAELDRRLKETYGSGLSNEEERVAKLVDRVRRRGSIKTDTEYRALVELADKLAQEDPSDEALTNEVRTLLGDYEPNR